MVSICIECRYPVPQLYHVFRQGSSSKSTSSNSKPPVQKPTDNSTTETGKAAAAAGTGPSNESRAPLPSTKIKETSRQTLLSSFNNSEASQNNPLRTSTATSSSSTTDVRLTQCPRCKKFADKYVEHDFVVLFIDLVLMKPQVYRHLLINRLDVSLSSAKTHFDPAILRLGLLLTLFDVYLTWSRIEGLPAEKTSRSPVPDWPVAVQYAFFMGLSLGGTLAQHLVVRVLGWLLLLRVFQSPQEKATADLDAASSMHGGGMSTTAAEAEAEATGNLAGSSRSLQKQPPPAPNSGVAISTALIVSSCMKLFPILMVVWTYDDASGQLARGVKVIVAVQNLEALRVVLGLAYWQAGLLVLAGLIAEDGVASAVLYFGGLADARIGWGLDVGRWFVQYSLNIA